MTDDELLDLIAGYERSALGSPVAAGATVGTAFYSSSQQMTTLEIDRFNALNMYYARPLGNETENSSSVVIPELRDTVEWIMPQLMRIFVAARTPCVFDPESEEDIEQAQLETEAVNHVLMAQNDGFFIVHDYCKDALLLRNGYIRVYWERRKKAVTERYSGLSQLELTSLLTDREDEQLEVIEQREYQVDMPAMLGDDPNAPAQRAAPMTVFDVRLRRTSESGHVCVECLPPEEVLVSQETKTNLDGARFVEHKSTKPRSDLIADGYDREQVRKMEPGRPSWLDMDSIARDVTTDQLATSDAADFAMQEIEVRDVTIRCDYDGDGIAELRHVLIGGDVIIENEEIEESSMCSGVPKRMPHRHTGLSMYDELADIQVIKSELARQGLNNLRLSNYGRTAVDWTRCNLTDLMTVRAGGVVRTNGPPSEILMPFEHPSNLIEQVLPMMEYVDRWREMRTGVGKDTVGLDPQALQNVTKGGQLAGMAAASLKIELIARCLAEGLKDVFLKVHHLLCRHQNQPMKLRLRGKWVEVDPSQWRERTRVSPNVGLGSGNRDEARQNLILLGQAMKEMAQFGLVGPKQAYNWFRRSAMLLGEDQPEQFVMDPGSDEFKAWQAQHPPQPNPQLLAAQTRLKASEIQAQASIAKAQASEHAADARAQAEIAHAALQNREDREVQMAQTDSEMFVSLAKILAQIVAAQLAKQPDVNAGEVLREDVASLEGRA